jgi:hypothetical protein
MNLGGRVSFVIAIILLFAATIGLPKVEAITYDLNADWSDSSNPNGVWSYNEGTNPLPHQADWDPGDFTPAQPAWARSSSITDHTFLPAWLRLSSAPTFALDLQIGDVALHTTDVTNGVGSGPGNVTWTSPIAGTVDLSGSVWEARDIGRSNRWSIDINGIVVSQGDISATNSSRSSPFDLASGTGGTAALNNISVSVGEVIKLQFDETSSDTGGDFVGVNFAVNVVTCTPPAPGLVAWYPGDGNANDIQGGNNGTLQGDVSFASGMVAQGFSLGGHGDLNGNGDRVLVGNPPVLQLQDFTIEGWIKRASATVVTNDPDAFFPNGTFFAYGSGGYGFFIDQPTNRLGLTAIGVSNVIGTSTITDTNYHHVAVTKQGGTVTFYIDGVADAPVSYDPVFTFTTGAAIGARGDNNAQNAFFGDIDEFSIYNRSLTAAEIQTIFDAASAGKCKPTLLNISTRLRVLTGDNVLIGGFIVTGTESKKVIVRAIGPSLGAFGVVGAPADPTLELHEPDGTIVTNDNWKDTQEAEIIATTIQPTNDLESAIVATLVPGAYTAIVSGKNGGTGVGLVEAYDLDQTAASQLANVSTRGFVDTGNNVMIGGFIVGGGAAGSASTSVIVRGIGPSLGTFGVAGALADPMLELHDSNGATLASNDNWRDTQEAEIIATTIPPTDDLESAIVATLAPGAYTAIVSGVNDTTGVGLVEAYNLQ